MTHCLLRNGIFVALPLWLASVAAAQPSTSVTGELKKWHGVTLTFTGPQTSESADPNPFRDYRLNVTFEHVDSGRSYTVPGFFAADGNAAETSADSGNQWRAHFAPHMEGQWRYMASFRQGSDIAASLSAAAGEPTAFDGTSGELRVEPTDKQGRDFRGKGLLQHVGHYLRFAETGEWFLKGGADSPENLLGYADFDGTYRHGGNERARREGEARVTDLHRYEPHIGDWQEGDPAWQDGKGRGLIGAMNYLASKGMNSVYFVTMNVTGDGKDVWPWIKHDIRDRFDCGKLDQWELVFSHMDRLGLMLHVITQEQENDQLLDEGELGLQRRLYYRELIARFSHHPAVVWNLGEENTNTTEQQKDFCRYIKAVDPYDHPIVVHTFPGKIDEVYSALLGFEQLAGPSLQTNNTHRNTLKWREESARSGHKWFVCLDEIGPAHTGVKPDADDAQHREVVHRHLWGNLLAGGAGCEWYFGYRFPHNDLNCEDWRSRDHLWDVTRHALTFFHEHLPFTEMTPADHLTSTDDAYCFAMEGWVYAVFVPDGQSPMLKLPEGSFTLRWYDPQNGGELQSGSIQTVEGGTAVELGSPPGAGDWIALVRKPRR